MIGAVVDKDQLAFYVPLGICPGIATIAVYLCGWHNEWVLILTAILSIPIGFILLSLIDESAFDEHGNLKTPFRKIIANGAGILSLLLIVTMTVLFMS